MPRPACRLPSVHLITATLLLLGLAACATTEGPERVREVVLQHLGGEYGTVGPLSKTAKKEFSVLAPADAARAAQLVDRGAVAFLAYRGGPGGSRLSRILLVAGGRVVGDFAVPATAP